MTYLSARGDALPAINEDRLWSRHMEMAQIGRIDGDGNCRLAMSVEDGAARALLAAWCEKAGLFLHVDRAGNMFAVRAGRSVQRAPIGSGSHLDTQPHGGRFDGISGVLAALEVMETLNDHGIVTDLPLAVVNWTNEEGVRYSPGLLGSAWYAGLLGDDDLAGLRSKDGVLFDDEARERGWLGPAGEKFAMSAFLELHIEQGPVLEKEGNQVGIVTSVQGLSWLDVKVRGTDGHAGTTPLAMREDALLASARMLVELNRIGLASGEAARVSVGRLTSATDGPSTIVGEAAFVIDIRHPDPAMLERLKQQCTQACRSIAQEARCRVEVEERIFVPPTDFAPDCLAALENSALSRGLRHRRITSGALHDAANVAKVVPTAMVFVPCRDGISHNVREYASPRDLADGTNVLMDAMVALAGR